MPYLLYYKVMYWWGDGYCIAININALTMKKEAVIKTMLKYDRITQCASETLWIHCVLILHMNRMCSSCLRKWGSACTLPQGERGEQIVSCTDCMPRQKHTRNQAYSPIYTMLNQQYRSPSSISIQKHFLWRKLMKHNYDVMQSPFCSIWVSCIYGPRLSCRKCERACVSMPSSRFTMGHNPPTHTHTHASHTLHFTRHPCIL